MASSYGLDVHVGMYGRFCTISNPMEFGAGIRRRKSRNTVESNYSTRCWPVPHALVLTGMVGTVVGGAVVGLGVGLGFRLAVCVAVHVAGVRALGRGADGVAGGEGGRSEHVAANGVPVAGGGVAVEGVVPGALGAGVVCRLGARSLGAAGGLAVLGGSGVLGVAGAGAAGLAVELVVELVGRLGLAGAGVVLRAGLGVRHVRFLTRCGRGTKQP